MPVKLCTWLVVALAGGAFIAGCGSSKSTSGTAASKTSVVGQVSVAKCKHTIQTQGKLSALTRAKLEEICEKAASGDPATVQKVAYEACVELIAASHVPPGADTEEALLLCTAAK